MHSIDRRKFLASSIVGAGFAGVMNQALAIDNAEVTPAIDCHTHFYSRHRKEGVLIPGKELPADLKAVAAPLGITGTIVVEASPVLENNQWLLDLAKDDSYVVGVVGNLSPGNEDFAKHLDHFAKNVHFRGIRVNHADLTTALSKPLFLDDMKRLADHDLALDVNGGPDMPADVARLADKLPNLRIVINHAANIDIDGAAPSDLWVRNMKAAAAHPRVFCKVSALVDQRGWEEGKAPAETSFYKPMLDAVWEIFGEDRLIYGSNWPVCEQYASYRVVYNIVDDYLKSKSPAAREKFFAINSQVAYRWNKVRK